MDIINVSCSEIQTPAGFLYVILPLLLNHTNNPDCDQSWYSQDGRLIADPVNPQTLSDPVISVSSDRLVTSRCVNLNHEIICDSADGSHFSHVTAFRARNQTAATPNPGWNETDSISGPTPTPESPESRNSQLWWLFALFIIVLLIISICFMLRKRIFRAAPSVFLCNESENRDPAVQTQLRSDSLNQSESEQINGSVSR